MTTHSSTLVKPDRRTILSTLWVFLSVTYIYCDVLTQLEPEVVQNLATGKLGTVSITPVFLLSAAVMMQIPFFMIVLARVLPYRANRWANIIAGAVMTLIQVGTLNMGTPPTLHYWFASAIEVVCNLFIVWYAWKWTALEA